MTQIRNSSSKVILRGGEPRCDNEDHHLLGRRTIPGDTLSLFIILLPPEALKEKARDVCAGEGSAWCRSYTLTEILLSQHSVFRSLIMFTFFSVETAS